MNEIQKCRNLLRLLEFWDPLGEHLREATETPERVLEESDIALGPVNLRYQMYQHEATGYEKVS